MKDNIGSVAHADCCGCGACVSICPQGCISFKEDRYGFFHPDVNVVKCISCGLCIRCCPVKTDGSLPEKQNVYACMAADDILRKKSSSGGIFGLFAKNCIAQNGVVYGAKFDINGLVCHERVDHMADLDMLIGSKYMQSRLEETYARVGKDISDGRNVLFSGTPCQIAALRGVLGKNPRNLLCMEVVCHGVPSKKAYESYLKWIENRYGSKVKRVNFRDKRKGWRNYHVTLTLENGKFIAEPSSQNLYMRGFIHNLYQRQSCENCRFKIEHSRADITLGDFWGIDSVFSHRYDPKDLGVSVVITSSVKGEECLDLLKDSLAKSDQVELDDATRYNPCIQKCSKLNPKRDLFFYLIGTKGFEKALIDCIGSPKNVDQRIASRFINLCKSIYGRIVKL